jgi:hypothetical protein
VFQAKPHSKRHKPERAYNLGILIIVFILVTVSLFVVFLVSIEIVDEIFELIGLGQLLKRRKTCQNALNTIFLDNLPT